MKVSKFFAATFLDQMGVVGLFPLGENRGCRGRMFLKKMGAQQISCSG